MSANGFNKLLKEAGKLARKVDYAKLAKAGKELAVGVGELLKNVPWTEVLKWIGIIGTAYGFGVLSMQPEISNLKESNEEKQNENERLRYAVAKLNSCVDTQQKKIEALKAYQFTEKAKSAAELRSVIITQYATKEYIEIAIKKSNGNNLSFDDKKFSLTFEKILNADYTEDDAKFVENFVIPKYKQKIDNLIEFDCTSLLEKLHA